jgi:ribonuclease-3
VRVADQLYGNGTGRSKKEAEQAAAETAYGEIAAALGVVDPIDAAVDAAVDAAAVEATTDATLDATPDSSHGS